MLLSKQSHLIRNISRFSSVLCQQAIAKDVQKEKNEAYHDQFKIKFKKLQINDKYLSTLMLLVKSKERRTKEEQIIVEGKQLITEAVESHFRLNYLVDITELCFPILNLLFILALQSH